MGRWAQRQRTGGAGSTLNYITRLETDSEFIWLATYRFPVTAGNFTPASFLSQPNDFVCVSVTPQGANELLLEFGDSLNGETSLNYSGVVANVLTPQTIELT